VRRVLKHPTFQMDTPLIIRYKKNMPTCLTGPDGWTAEFYHFFFELVGQDLVDMVEETRLKGEVTSSIYSTFVALIPKVNIPSVFNDYRPISLCNLCYKLISKVIAKRLRPILSRVLSEEQLGFLSKVDKSWMPLELHRSVSTALSQKSYKQLS
jgi:hypothetical protein